MTRTFRLGLAQINPTVGDILGNTRKIIEYIERAREVKADLVAFPEMAITGYPPEDLLFKPDFLRDNVAAMRQIVEFAQGIAVVVGYVETAAGIFNAAALGNDGQLIDSYRKQYLPNYGVFDEFRYFRQGDSCPVYIINGVGVGVNICEDIWYSVGPVAVQKQSGAELIVNINASPFHVGKRAYREKMISTRSADNQLFVAYLNTVGGQDELVFDGASLVYSASGELIIRGPSFTEELIVVDFEVNGAFCCPSRGSRTRKTDATNLRGVGTAKVVIVSDFLFRDRPPIPPSSSALPMDEVEEVYHALVLGTRDYVRKSGFTQALVSLSGGVDSSLTATIAADALGPQNVLGVTMPSRHSSEGSINDSRELADNLGIGLWVVPIETVHVAFAELLEPYFRDTEPNVAEENFQSRIRGNIMMTISNKFGWIVLSTGNKSEMAMGFATLYGDMAGGFAVIKDVPKTMVYSLCHWRNLHGKPSNVISPNVLNKPPSAELKPGQLDSDSLPPYEILDPIVKSYVEQDSNYQEMVQQGYNPQMIAQVISFVDRNEYKRRQAPPGIKITPRAFGKDRRLPIVNRYGHGSPLR